MLRIREIPLHVSFISLFNFKTVEEYDENAFKNSFALFPKRIHFKCYTSEYYTQQRKYTIQFAQ